MEIVYRDKLGYVSEIINQHGISFLEGIAYFNNREIDTKYIVFIGEKRINKYCDKSDDETRP